MKKFTLVTITQLIMTLTGLCGSLMWTRFADPLTYGTFLLFISILPIAAAFSAKGLDYSAQISGSKNLHKNLDNIVKLRLRLSLLGSMVLLCFSGYYWYQSLYNIFYASIFAAVLFPIYNLKSILESWLNGAGNFGWLCLFAILPQISFLVILYFVLLLGEYIASLLFLLIFVTFSFNLLFLNIIKNSKRNSLSDLEAIKYGRSIGPAFVIAISIASLDKIIVSSVVSIEAVAIFAIALMPSEYLKGVFSIFSRLLTPVISSSSSIRSAWLAISLKFWILSALFFFIGIFCLFFIDDVVVFIFGIDYSVSGGHARGLCASAALCCTPTLLGNILRAQKRIGFVYSFEFFNSSVKFVSFLLGGYLYGLDGMIYGLIFCNIASAFFFVIYFLWEYFYERHD